MNLINCQGYWQREFREWERKEKRAENDLMNKKYFSIFPRCWVTAGRKNITQKDPHLGYIIVKQTKVKDKEKLKAARQKDHVP